MTLKNHQEILRLDVDLVTLTGELTLPDYAHALVIFSYGNGPCRFNPRTHIVAQHLHRKGIGTFLFDLLTEEEDQVYTNWFNIHLLANRLVGVTTILLKFPHLKNLPIGYFSASTGAAAALIATSTLKNKIKAVVSKGGRPDLAGNRLYNVESPTLLLVGDHDVEVLELNGKAFEKIEGVKKLTEVKGASHLFEEPGTLEVVAALSVMWFEKYLTSDECDKTVQQLNFR
jgi:putative phosphoribosyl transferase